jgi:hypothetical protein
MVIGPNVNSDASEEPGGSAMQVSVKWESTLKFYTKSARDKLVELSTHFGFSVDPDLLSDHERLAEVRWLLQDRLGKNNRFATRALTKLYFSYLRHGRVFLDDHARMSELFNELASVYADHSCGEAISSHHTSQVGLSVIDARAINSLMEQYHFLGYGRTGGYHLGMSCPDGSGLAAAATFSPWDMDHATPILEHHGIKPAEVLVLSRLLSISSARRLPLSQFIAMLMRWVRKEMPEIKLVVTYCNPNAGHYGTVYRGSNFLPLCTEYHPFVPFSGDEYVSPRKLAEVYYCQGEEKCRSILRPGVVKPMPLLIYYYPVRSGGKKKELLPGHCKYPYPIDLYSTER